MDNHPFVSESNIVMNVEHDQNSMEDDWCYNVIITCPAAVRLVAGHKRC